MAMSMVLGGHPTSPFYKKLIEAEYAVPILSLIPSAVHVAFATIELVTSIACAILFGAFSLLFCMCTKKSSELTQKAFEYMISSAIFLHIGMSNLLTLGFSGFK